MGEKSGESSATSQLSLEGPDVPGNMREARRALNAGESPMPWINRVNCGRQDVSKDHLDECEAMIRARTNFLLNKAARAKK